MTKIKTSFYAVEKKHKSTKTKEFVLATPSFFAPSKRFFW